MPTMGTTWIPCIMVETLGANCVAYPSSVAQWRMSMPSSFQASYAIRTPSRTRPVFEAVQSFNPILRDDPSGLHVGESPPVIERKQVPVRPLDEW